MSGLQLPLFGTESDWEPPRVPELPSWAQAKRVAIDLETCDPQLKKLGIGVRRDGYPVGVSFAIEDGPSFYLPFGHLGGGNMAKGSVVEYLRDQARAFKGTLVGANISYDLDYLASENVIFSPEKIRDIQVAETLIDELHHRYSLDACAARHGLQGKDEEELRRAAELYGVHPKHEMWKLPAKHVAAYATQDVELPLELLRRQERIIEDQDLWGIYNLESDLIPILVKMRRRGVRIDHDQLSKVEAWCIEQVDVRLREIRNKTTSKITRETIAVPSVLGDVLRSIGVEPPRTAKNKQDSVTNDLLQSIDHEVPRLLLRARQIDKVRTTFVKSVREHEVNGRIHCTFHQLRKTDDNTDDSKGGRFGRMSCSDPNLQQQPARDKEIGPMWRKIYIPEEGAFWACADFSQQEPRWTTHFAERIGAPGAAEAANRYRTDPSTDNHVMMAEMTGLKRKDAKEFFLGICYGMGGPKLCSKLGLPTKWIETRSGKLIEVAGDEGEALLQQFHARAPYVKWLSDECQRVAKKRGWIRTILGRRCRFPRHISGKGFDWTHKALNRLIQGSSGDQTKAAMVRIEKEGIAPIQLQVHDELDWSASSMKQVEEVSTIMRECVPSSVPFKVDAEVGPSWGEIE